MNSSRVLVTGAAGFIGFHVSKALLQSGRPVLGLDNVNDYYDPALKRDRLKHLQLLPGFEFTRLDLADQISVGSLFEQERFEIVIHLAAQPGVRFSLTDPHAYVSSNLAGFTNVLEGCRHHGCRHLLYASSSSVYGNNSKTPFSVQDRTDHPVSFYGATKKANELMAHSYSHLYRLPTTGLRFFTVYGPWGRPDMAVWSFVEAIFSERPIKLFNSGQLSRDFTYIDDVVKAVVGLTDRPPSPAEDPKPNDPGKSSAPWRIYNIGNNRPTELLRLVSTIENAVGKSAIRQLEPMQPGDVFTTYADVDDLIREVGFSPSTSIEEGVSRFVEWYRNYRGL
jgi:UDP-glucuronate 4-epimerase